jgi:hypothetical protein
LSKAEPGVIRLCFKRRRAAFKDGILVSRPLLFQLNHVTEGIAWIGDFYHSHPLIRVVFPASFYAVSRGAISLFQYENYCVS